jgi:polygalacturonase
MRQTQFHNSKTLILNRVHKIALPFLISVTLFSLSQQITAQKNFNVMDYGAKNDGSKKNTQAIVKAIEAAVKAGGGTVFFPAGLYLTGPIQLQSNITIFIDAGAVLKFSDDFDDYLPMVSSRWEGTDVMNFSPLFYAYKAENIAIVGRGVIDGQGKKWWDYHHELYSKPKDFRSKWQIEFARQNTGVSLPEEPGMITRGFCRPPFIQPMYCKNIRIEGIMIYNSPFWTVNPEFCDNVTVTGVTIVNPTSPNTDGINPESCRNVHISDCHISVGDDCITIKSGKDKAGREKNIPAENYTITNCTMLSGHGGVVIGSEMSGGVKKIVISNCIFDGTDRGVRIKTARGRGGVVEDISVSNIIMKNIRDEAITLNMFYDKSSVEPVSERTPQFRNIHFSNITGNAKQAGTLIGLEEMPIENISFSNINLKTQTGFTISNSKNVRFYNLQIDTEDSPAIVARESRILEINGLRCLNPLQGSYVIEFMNVQDAWVHNCYQPAETALFLKIDGVNSKEIKISDNYLPHTKTDVQKTDVVPESTIHKQ